ncbi:MAG: hypothetical protein D8M61_09145 [Ignavibacteriae bacterium]|nr:hypothetical protein [Ignavibacteriota bacterium]
MLNPNYAKEKIARCFSSVNPARPAGGIEQTSTLGFNPKGFGPAHRQRRAKVPSYFLFFTTVIPACRTGRNDGAIKMTIFN